MCQSLAEISAKRLSAAPSFPRWNSSVLLSLLVLNDRGRCLWSRDVRVWVSGRHATPPRRQNSVRWTLIQCEWVNSNQATSPMPAKQTHIEIVKSYQGTRQLLRMLTSSAQTQYYTYFTPIKYIYFFHFEKWSFWKGRLVILLYRLPAGWFFFFTHIPLSFIKGNMIKNIKWMRITGKCII